MVYINTTGKINEVWLDKPYGTVIVDCPECPDSGDTWASGYTSGYTDGLAACSGSPEDWQEGYDSGHTDGYQEGYDSGRTDGYGEGEAAQKAKLSSTSITENGEYTSEDGFSAVTVNVPQTGSTIRNQQKSINIQDVPMDYAHDPKGGWNYFPEITVTPDSGYTGLESVRLTGVFHPTEALATGYDSGTSHQKSLLSSTSITQNGTYTRADGWSSVTINVSGYSQADLDAAFASGWSAGYQSGYTDGSDTGYTPAPPVSGSDGMALYLVTSTTDPTKVIGVGTVSGEVKLPDSTPVTLVNSSYTFDQTGIQALVFSFTGMSYYDDPTTPGVYDEKIYPSIGGEQFEGVNQLVSIVIPEGIELTDHGAFEYCQLLSSVTLPNSLEIIGEDSFRGTGLVDITIPANVKYIYGWAFIYSDDLTGMTFLGTTPPTLGGSYALNTYDKTFPIYVPASAVNTYKTAWPNYASRIQAIPNNG